MNTHTRWAPGLSLCTALLILSGILFTTTSLHAQPPQLPDTMHPRLPIYGIGDDEFMIAGLVQ